MDNEIKRLLKDSLLKIPSEDFTDQTMRKINEISEGLRVQRKIKWTCLFIAMTVLLIPIEFALLSKLISIFRTFMTQSMQSLSDSTYIDLSIVIAVTFILIFQLDNLIRLIMDNKKIETMGSHLK